MKTIEWVYDATGTKLKKLVKSGGAIQYTQHYSSGIEYRQGATGAPVIEAIYHPEGRVFYTSATASRYEYSIRDHLGNTRLTFSDLNNNNKVDITTTTTNEVLQENHYYPFGLSTNGAWMNSATSPDNLYQYNGKELNNNWGLNMIDYGARMYMADLGRWGGVDDKVMEYQRTSPYVFVLNNPMNFMDPDGETVVPQNLSAEQKAKYEERMNRLNELGKKSPTIRRVVDEANSEDVMIHLYTFSSDRSDKTETKSKHYPTMESLEKRWAGRPKPSGITISMDVATADVILSDYNLTPENEGGTPGEYRADLVLLDELSHATSDVSRMDPAKEAFDHYTLFSSLSSELENLGEWGVYVGGQVRAKLEDSQKALTAAYANEIGKDVKDVTFDDALLHYQKKYETK